MNVEFASGLVDLHRQQINQIARAANLPVDEAANEAFTLAFKVAERHDLNRGDFVAHWLANLRQTVNHKLKPGGAAANDEEFGEEAGEVEEFQEDPRWLALQKFVPSLTARDQKLVAALDGAATFEEVGARLGFTRQQAREVTARLQKKLTIIVARAASN